MDFETQIPEWQNEGTEPSENLKTNGFKEGYKPPAGIFNWFWSKISKAIAEIQNNLSNVDNTKDSEKAVKFASEAGIGRKLKYALTVRFKGGRTEGTDLWTFNGETSKSINITPEKIGARPTEKPNIVVNAVREETDEKEIYTATDSNITELYNGLEITIIPNETNMNLSPRLKINDFEDKAIRLALSFNCAATNALKTNFIQANRPITLKYHSELNLGIQGQGAWIFCDRQKTSAQDLYGSVPIESGGTGADTAEEALENLGVANYMVESGFANSTAGAKIVYYEKFSNGIIKVYTQIRCDKLATGYTAAGTFNFNDVGMLSNSLICCTASLNTGDAGETHNRPLTADYVFRPNSAPQRIQAVVFTTDASLLTDEYYYADLNIIGKWK